MTVEDVIKKETNVKRIGFRSIRNGKIIEYYKKPSDIPKNKMCQATPGYINIYGYLTIDVHF
jgi:hypothetical protein|nr:MAG TPA: hypothetical protein [Caudoviricetes sp.]